MSDGVMTYEDWLRGCVHHDGRHGYVTLPCDEVLKIAEFIERLRADHKTENSSEKPNNCETCKWGEWYRKGYDITMMDDECGGCCSWNSKWTPKDEPQTVVIIGTPSHEFKLKNGQTGNEPMLTIATNDWYDKTERSE